MAIEDDFLELIGRVDAMEATQATLGTAVQTVQAEVNTLQSMTALMMPEPGPNGEIPVPGLGSIVRFRSSVNGKVVPAMVTDHDGGDLLQLETFGLTEHAVHVKLKSAQYGIYSDGSPLPGYWAYVPAPESELEDPGTFIPMTGTETNSNNPPYA